MISAKPDITARCLMPLLYLSLAGMTAGAVWLILLSQWHVIWIGLLAIFFSPYLIPILMMPAGILSHFMALSQNAGKKLREKAFYAVSILYIVLLITFFAASAFTYVTSNVSAAALMPALIWAASSAGMPWLLWASGDRNNVFVATIVVAAVGSLLLLCFWRVMAGPLPFLTAAFALAAPTLLVTTSRILYDDRKAKSQAR